MVRPHKMGPFGGRGGNEGYNHDSYIYPQPASEDSGFVLDPGALNQAQEYELVEDKILSEMAGPIVEIVMLSYDMDL